MRLLSETLENITGSDEGAKVKGWQYLDSLSKPVRSLGQLEEIVVKVAGITGEVFNSVNNKNILIFCSDNGICEEGVSGCHQDITTIVTNNLPNYTTGVGVLAKYYNSKLTVVDVGIKGEITNKAVVNKSISKGSNNMAYGPAMTREQAIKAIEVGIEMVDKACGDGCDLLGTGEMGIGNTSTSVAVIASISELDVEELVGLGAGLTSGQLENKKRAIKKAIEINKPKSYDVIDVISKVGGYDIAALCGAFIGAAKNRVPIVIDGLITCAAALCAYKLNENTRDYMFPSHKSSEKAVNVVFQQLELQPMLSLDMRLGEGSGCPMAFSIIESALYMARQMDTFNKAGIDPGEEENYKKLFEERKNYEKIV